MCDADQQELSLDVGQAAQAEAHKTEIEFVRAVKPKNSADKKRQSLEARSPMVGKIVNVFVESGKAVKEGDVLCSIEAMKMENRILAEAELIVDKVHVKTGDTINSGDLLVSFKQATAWI